MKDPLIVVVIMVKNEETAIVNTLKPFSLNGVKHMCVFDTGSTDNTIEVTKNFFKEHQIEGYIDQEPFIDFATSRNRGLEYAEQHFPQATFFIIPDADWYIHNVKNLLNFCEQDKSSDTPLYLIRVTLDDTQYYSARLFRVSAHNRYIGAVHEVPEFRADKKIDEVVFFEHAINPKNRRQSEMRYKRDAELLLSSVEKNPVDSRSLFYLAQTYECLTDYKNAYRFYLKRSRITGWNEEDALTFYRLGYLTEFLSQTEEEYSWPMALNYYLKSFSLRSSRIEPLVKIAEYYQRDNPQISAVYMKYACSVPYPYSDLLFVIGDIYKYKRYEILSICAWYIGEYELGKQATEIALSVSPESEMLKKNLEIYKTSIASSHRREVYQTTTPIITTNNILSL